MLSIVKAPLNQLQIMIFKNSEQFLHDGNIKKIKIFQSEIFKFGIAQFPGQASKLK